MSHKNLKRVVISGCYGAGNVGDDALLESILVAFFDRFRNVKITVLSNNPEVTLNRLQGYNINILHDVDFFNPYSFYGCWIKGIGFKIMKLLFKSDVLVLGGGEIIREDHGFNHLLERYVKIILMKMFRGKVVLYGVGIGSIKSFYAKELTRIVLNAVDFIGVRDDPSKDTLRGLGIVGAPVKVMPDPVLTFSKKKDLSPDLEKLCSSLSRPILVASVIDNYRNNSLGDRFSDSIAAGFDRFLETYGGSILFLPFGISNTQSDVVASEKVVSKMDYKDACVVLREFLLPLTIKSLVSKADLMFTFRLHGAVFAISECVPFIAINYDPKVKKQMETLGIGDIVISLASISEKTIFSKLNKLLKQNEKIRNKLRGVNANMLSRKEYIWEFLSKILYE